MQVLYLIRRSTLEEIADAIRHVRGLTSHIPVSEFDDVLSGKSVSNTTPDEAVYDLYVIDRQKLVDVANVIRDLGGMSGEIPVLEMGARIRALTELVQGKTAKLGKAILGRAILGNSTGLNRLGAPTISLVDGIEKLDTPTIEIVTITDEPKLDTPSIILETDKLDTPVIYLWDSKLGTPTIRLYSD